MCLFSCFKLRSSRFACGGIALAGKLGNLDGVSVKTAYSNVIG